MITYKSASDYLMRNIAGDYVLIKIRNYGFGNTNVYVFNDTGAFLWDNLSEGKNKVQLATLLMENFGIEQMQAKADVDTFLEKCVAEGFVSMEGEGEI